MATDSQINANRANALLSSGPKTLTGKEISSGNRIRHGLRVHENKSFYFLEDEMRDKFRELHDRLTAEHQPQTETEEILVRRMTEAEWLRTRALRFQRDCLDKSAPFERLSLFIRYETTHERAFYKALNELQKLRAERRKIEIGFERLKRHATAEDRAGVKLEMQKEEFEWKKTRRLAASSAAKANAAPGTAPEGENSGLP